VLDGTSSAIYYKKSFRVVGTKRSDSIVRFVSKTKIAVAPMFDAGDVSFRVRVVACGKGLPPAAVAIPVAARRGVDGPAEDGGEVVRSREAQNARDLADAHVRIREEASGLCHA